MQIDGLIDAWQAAWSNRDHHAFAEICVPDVHYEDPLTPEPLLGPDAIAAHAARVWAGFPDARLERTGERLSDGRFIVAPCRLLGTHQAPLEQFPASGHFIVVHGLFYCELHPGTRLLWRVRGFYDVYGAGVQLGILPARGTLGERALLVLRGFGVRGAAPTLGRLLRRLP